jgi:hypothetical protein
MCLGPLPRGRVVDVGWYQQGQKIRSVGEAGVHFFEVPYR